MDDDGDAAMLTRCADALAGGVEAALAGWVVAAVERRAGRPDLRPAARAAGEEARREVGGAVRELLALDVDAQRTTPLALVRSAVRYPTRVLAGAGVPPVARDRVAVEAFPDDPYDLTPGSLADLDPDLVEAGIAWGAAKAHTVLRRRR